MNLGPSQRLTDDQIRHLSVADVLRMRRRRVAAPEGPPGYLISRNNAVYDADPQVNRWLYRRTFGVADDTAIVFARYFRYLSLR